MRALYGGAIRATLPANAVDISKLRQVPDNQEVFAHPITDQSIIVDILEYIPDVSDEEAIEHHFKELVDYSDDAHIIEKTKLDKKLPEVDSIHYLYGQQLASKYKEHAKNLVNLHLVLVRMRKHSTDILITFNDTAFINPESSSYEASSDDSNQKWTGEQFMKLVETFEIVDYSLFAGADN